MLLLLLLLSTKMIKVA